MNISITFSLASLGRAREVYWIGGGQTDSSFGEFFWLDGTPVDTSLKAPTAAELAERSTFYITTQLFPANKYGLKVKDRKVKEVPLCQREP